MRVILMGAQGSGKGTQAGVLAAEFSIPHISTGDILRAAIQAGTPLGNQAKALVEAGKLVPDDVIVGIVAERLRQPDCRAGFVLDGFPRTLAQAEALDALLRSLGIALTAVVDLAVPRATLLERLAGRRICARCGAIYHVRFSPPREASRCDRCGGELVQRSDDQPDAIAARLDAYERQTGPVLEYYRGKGLLRPVDGTAPVSEVTAAIRRAVGG